MMRQPVRRQFSCDSPFFDVGNLERAISFKCLTFAKAECIEELMDTTTKNIECPICGLHFTFIKEWDEHYSTSHRFQCSICSRLFFSDRLLSIHISEAHDSYFAVISIKHPSYQCLVDGCDIVSISSKARKKHLVVDHKFPRSFRFQDPSLIAPPKPSSTDHKTMRPAVTLKQKKKEWKMRGKAQGAYRGGEMDVISDADNGWAMNDEENYEAPEGTITSKGARRTTDAATITASSEPPSDMDEVVNQLAGVSLLASCRRPDGVVNVPKLISFGGRGRGRGNRSKLI